MHDPGVARMELDAAHVAGRRSRAAARRRSGRRRSARPAGCSRPAASRRGRAGRDTSPAGQRGGAGAAPGPSTGALAQRAITATSSGVRRGCATNSPGWPSAFHGGMKPLAVTAAICAARRRASSKVTRLKGPAPPGWWHCAQRAVQQRRDVLIEGDRAVGRRLLGRSEAVCPAAGLAEQAARTKANAPVNRRIRAAARGRHGA